jgi:CPA2 family monovalent cation:H+ antiporter-2
VHLPPFLLELALALAIAAAVAVACRAVRLPPVVGLLLTGVLVGPSALGWVAASVEARVFAEIGVVALLFTLGLEFSRRRIERLRHAFFAAGPLQFAGVSAAATGLALVAGLAWRQAVFVGFLVALSSTAVVLRLYVERRQLDAPHGRTALGVLLFQDVMLAPLLALTPVLAGTVEGGAGAVALRFALSVGVVAAAFVAARFVLPPLLGRVFGARMPDVFILAAVATCLAGAGLTAALGFSPALGAFLAGVLLADSDFSHEVAADMAPFRDLFTNFFFISVGLLVDLSAIGGRVWLVLALSAVVVVLKAVLTSAAGLVAGVGLRAAATAGLGLAQIGEFSFVLAGVGASAGLLGDELYQLVLAVTVVTLLATPGLVGAAPFLAGWLVRLSRRGEAAAEVAADKSGHVLVAGYGLNGRNLGRVLSEAKIPWLALDLDRRRVREARRRGEPVLLGDASRRELLVHCGIERARVAVFAFVDPWALQRAVAVTRRLAPRLFIIARTRMLDEVDLLAELGADEVVAEELETSIELLTRVLRRYHVPRNVVDAEVRVLRAGGYEMLRRPGRSGAVTRTLLAALERGTTEIFRLEEGAAAVGRTLADLDLRRASGASVVAVVRDGTPRTNPPPDLTLEVGDDLVLVGGHAEIEAAFRVLGG